MAAAKESGAEALIYRRIAPAAESLGENRASAYGL
jgi:hypothetical protein